MFDDTTNEITVLVKLAVPMIILNSLEMSIWIVDIVMLGRLGRGHLAAGGLGYTVFNMLWMVMEGLLTAQDVFCSQAFVATNFVELRKWTYVALAVAMGISLIGTLIFAAFPWIIYALSSSNQHLAFKASQEVLMLIPCLWLMSVSRVLQKYFTSQQKYVPMMVLSTSASMLNAIGLSSSDSDASTDFC